MESKETRVFILPAWETFAYGTDEIEIEGVARDKYIELCEKAGTVYSIQGFAMAFNADEISDQDHILILENY